MSKKPETKFRKKAVDKLESLPKTVIFSIQQRSIVGTPDIFMCLNGHFVAIEFKSSIKEDPSPLQRYNLDKIIEANGEALVCAPENFDSVYAQLTVLSKTSAKGEKL